MVMHHEADFAGAWTLGVECGMNLDNGVITFNKLHQITGSCESGKFHVEGRPGREVRWLLVVPAH
jgi:hypothetical protein